MTTSTNFLQQQGVHSDSQPCNRRRIFEHLSAARRRRPGSSRCLALLGQRRFEAADCELNLMRLFFIHGAPRKCSHRLRFRNCASAQAESGSRCRSSLIIVSGIVVSQKAKHGGKVRLGPHLSDHLRVCLDPCVFINRRRLTKAVTRIHEDTCD